MDGEERKGVWGLTDKLFVHDRERLRINNQSPYRRLITA